MKINIENFKPIKDLILVEFEPIPLQKKSKSGIILSVTKDAVLDRPTSGVVLAQGSEVGMDLVGKTVYFENIRGQDLTERHLVISDKHVLGYKDEL